MFSVIVISLIWMENGRGPIDDWVQLRRGFKRSCSIFVLRRSQRGPMCVVVDPHDHCRLLLPSNGRPSVSVVVVSTGK